MFFAACESDVTEVKQDDKDFIEVVASVKDLPKCSDGNDGLQVIVKGETSVRVCIDGDWSESGSVEDAHDTVFVDKDVSCKIEELKDKSGYRIVCNGDSVGVVVNENEGKDIISDTVYVDKDVSCKIEELADSSGLRIMCNGDSVGVVLNENEGKDTIPDTVYVDKEVSCTTVALQDSSGLKIVCNGDSIGTVLFDSAVDTSEVETDTEKVATVLDSLVGVVQEGLFVENSSVLLYELSDGRTLSQTGKSYTAVIGDSKKYKITACNLPSQYVMLVAQGATTSLRAISDVSARKSVNVNALTHLELERVNNLVTKQGMSFKAAKKQAMTEILGAFHIDPSLYAPSEDLDIFGTSDADAALLAISVLLKSNLNDKELSALLASISSDIESDGVWDDAKARVQVAEWAMKAEMSGLLEKIRTSVQGMASENGSVPDFEKFVSNYWKKELGVGSCDASGDNEVVDIANELSSVKQLECNSGAWNLVAMRDLRDNETYKVVTIGDQVWTAENIRHKTDEYYNPNGNSANADVYGLLYTWENAKNVCPAGWHLPSKAEFETLRAMAYDGGDKSGVKLKSKEGWDDEGNGSDEFGFAAYPAGDYYEEDYLGFSQYAEFWSSTESGKETATLLVLRGSLDGSALSSYEKSNAMSVRCLLDE